MSRKVDYSNPSEADRAWAGQFKIQDDQIKMADSARELEESSRPEAGDELAAKPDYAKLNKSELVAEVDRRNKEDKLDPPLNNSGSKADLIEVLEQDDRDAAAVTPEQ